MSIVWAMRSDNASFKARYSPSGLTPGLHFSTQANASPIYDADVNAIGGNRYNLSASGTALTRALLYPGRGVCGSKTISVLLRAQVLSSALIGMFDLKSSGPQNGNEFMLYQNASVWKSFITDKNGVSVANSAAMVTQAPDTTHYQDFVLTWDGTTTASKIMLWIDGVNVGNATAGTAWSNPQDANLTDSIGVGGNTAGIPAANMYVNEMVIWNTVINPASIVLTGSTAALNGSSRTQFVDVAAFDGTNSTDPGIAKVKSGTAYTINGVALTGAEPGAAGGSFPFIS